MERLGEGRERGTSQTYVCTRYIDPFHDTFVSTTTHFNHRNTTHHDRLAL